MSEGLQPYKPIEALQDVISRTVKVENTTPPTVINCIQSNQLTDFNLVVRETSGVTDISLTITLSQANSEFIIKQPINRGGAFSYQGFGSIRVQAEAINAGTGLLELSLTPQSHLIPYIMVAGQTTRQSLPVALNYYAVESLSNATPAGYAPPFTKFLAMKPSGDSVIRFVDITGTVIWQSGIMAADDDFFKEIRIFPWYRIDIRPQAAAQFVSSLWYN